MNGPSESLYWSELRRVFQGAGMMRCVNQKKGCASSFRDDNAGLTSGPSQILQHPDRLLVRACEPRLRGLACPAGPLDKSRSPWRIRAAGEGATKVRSDGASVSRAMIRCSCRVLAIERPFLHAPTKRMGVAAVFERVDQGSLPKRHG